MLSRTFFACLLLGLCRSGSSLSCRWLDHKFRQHSEDCVNLLDTLANNSTNTTADAEDAVAFPAHLYSQASNASAEHKLAFTVQVLEQVAALFEEDHSAASWEESTVENLLNVVNKQADELRSCLGGHGHKKRHTKLHMYFKRLSNHVLKNMGHSAEAWELIRRVCKDHLMRAQQLAAPGHPAN